MSINIGPPAVEELRPRITVIGVGGAGGNAIANMIQAGIEGVDFVVANTDAQALNNSIAENRIQLGPDITQGLGAGSRPEVGRAAAEETMAEIERALDGVHMCFIAAGMGGGTGTGAAPVVAKLAREKGVLTVGVVTKPFLFEGTRRMRSAEAGIEELQRHVDTLIVIPNQNLFLVAKAETTFKEAFQLADEVLQQGVRSITDLMVMPGLINLDFADVRSVMAEMGKAMMGTGEGSGENRALEAAEKAIANPLLDGVSMQGAKGVIISIIGGEDMKLLEVDEAANHIRELVDPNANIIWGSAFNPDLQGKIRVSVVATGIEQSAEQAEEASRPFSLGGSRGPARPPVAAPVSQPLFEREAPAPAPVASQPEPEPEPAPVAQSEPEPEPAPAPAKFYDDDEDDWGLDPTGEEAASDEPLELEQEAGGGNGDELLLDASRLASDDEPAGEDDGQPRRRRGLLARGDAIGDAGGSGGDFAAGGGAVEPAASGEPAPRAPRLGGGGGASGGGATLFERMANLSRGGRSAKDDDEDEDDHDSGPSISIPRFLGRQNNQQSSPFRRGSGEPPMILRNGLCLRLWNDREAGLTVTMARPGDQRVGRRITQLLAGAALALAGPALQAQTAGVATVSQPVVQAIPGGQSGRLNGALSRLARNSQDVAALIDAGQASLDLGDVQAAIGFYQRAGAIAPGNGDVKAGLATAFLQAEDPLNAIPLFDEAAKSGALGPQRQADRGLAYDLVGDNVSAQQYYREALAAGPDDETTRRLALSQAISGDKRGMETTLAPLLQKQDKSSWRTRAFALAIIGQTEEAEAIARSTLPADMAGAIAAYLRFMPRLTAAQQAAAANLGRFPRAADIGIDDPRFAQYARPRTVLATASRSLTPAGPPLGAKPRDDRQSRRAREQAAKTAAKSETRPVQVAAAAPPEPRPGREAVATPLSPATSAAPAMPTPARPSSSPVQVAAAAPPVQPAAAKPASAPSPAPGFGSLDDAGSKNVSSFDLRQVQTPPAQPPATVQASQPAETQAAPPCAGKRCGCDTATASSASEGSCACPDETRSQRHAATCAASAPA